MDSLRDRIEREREIFFVNFGHILRVEREREIEREKASFDVLYFTEDWLRVEFPDVDWTVYEIGERVSDFFVCLKF